MLASRCLTVWIALTAIAAAEPVDPAAALDRWVESQADLTSVEAEFVQTRELPALRVPLRTEGRLWMAKGGFFRWQTGEPAGVVLLRTSEGAWLAWPRRREFQRVDLQGGNAGEWLAALEFPGGMGREEFRDRFEVMGVSIDAEGVCRAELLPKEAQARKFVASMVLRFVVDGGKVLDFEIRLKDGSALGTEFRSVRVDQPVDWSVFRMDTSGWREVGL